jgi:hypothetical protein
VKLLAAELWVNHVTLGAAPEMLLSATVQHGAVAPELLKEFSKESPLAVTNAMEHRPISPWTALERSTRQKER